MSTDRQVYSRVVSTPLTRFETMETFELKIDLNTPYIKVIRFLGAALFGFFIAATILTFKYESHVDWMNSLTGIILSICFAFFPGTVKNQRLNIDESGIYLHNYTFNWGQKKELSWEKVRAIGVHKNVIEIKNSIGSTEKINIPIHTKSQLEDLKSYLKKMTDIKGLEYIS